MEASRTVRYVACISWCVQIICSSLVSSASPASVCVNVVDGSLHSHPERCDLFIECSHGYTYVRECGPTLFFNPEKGVCDYRHATVCKFGNYIPNRLPGPTDHVHRPYQETVYGHSPVEKYSAHVPVSELREYCKVVMKESRSSTLERISNEIYMSEQMKNVVDSFPFRGVANFLKSRPYAKMVSKSAMCMIGAFKLIRDKFHFSGPQVLDVLRDLGYKTMLQPMPGQYRPDTPMPVIPDVNYCPYPNDIICDEHTLVFRSNDGSCNSLSQPIIGRSMTPFRRLVRPRYEDGIEEIRRSVTGIPLPGARFVSFNLFPDVDRPSRQTTMMFVFFGQLTDHDLTRTALTMVTEPDPAGGEDKVTQLKCGTDGCMTGPGLEACLPIPVPDDDPDFAQFNRCLKFVRDMEVPPLNCEIGAREHLDQVTHWIDGSEVYGSTKEEMDLLRDYSDARRGKMLVVDHPHGSRYKPLLPKEVVTNSMPSECKNFNDTHVCLQAGDPRVNENAGLGTIHIMLIRHHNHIEERLHRINPGWDGERLYQETRRIMVAFLQHILFNEWLPLMLGPSIVKKYELDLVASGYYKGYEPNIDARVPNEFVAAAFRIGHTFLQERLRRVDSHSRIDDRLFLSETFNRPVHFYDTPAGGIDGFIRGLADEPSQTHDTFFTKQITRGLFSEKPPHGPGHDLLSLNIQRGRDHGIGTYNDMREFCGLTRARSFDDLSGEIIQEAIRHRLSRVYREVDDIDLFPGGISERSVDGGLAGPTFACIIANTFRALRKGDRFWYENAENGFTPYQLQEIRKMKMSRILCTNGDYISKIQPFVFLLPGKIPVFAQSAGDGIYNNPVSCDSLPDIDLSLWKS